MHALPRRTPVSDILRIAFALAGICFSAMLIGGSFAFGVATVCRWMKWAPVNTIVNVSDSWTRVVPDPVSSPGEPNG
jgi:hypothetical protein